MKRHILFSLIGIQCTLSLSLNSIHLSAQLLNRCKSALTEAAHYLPTDKTLKNMLKVIDRVGGCNLKKVMAYAQQQHNWSDSYTDICEEEFRRFMIISVAFPKVEHILDSTDVDKVWHAFILFTRDYAAFCEHIAGTFIHHSPVDLNQLESPEEHIKNISSYAEMYRFVFGQNPSPIVWKIPCDEKTCKTVTR